MLPFAAALAQAADAPAPEPEPAPPVSEEVTVVGEAVEQARQQVIAQVEALGYDKVRRKDDRTVFRDPDTPYHGKVVLYDDGRLATRRTGPAGRKIEPIAGTRVRPYFLCLVDPMYCVSGGSWYVASSKWRQYEDRVVEATAAPLGTLGDRLADQALAAKLEVLPDGLDALWTRGIPLEGGPALVTYEERRAALLDYWDSRTETTWGLAVRELVAGFVRAEVQRGDHPYTAEEQAAFDARRRSAEPFPWSPPPDP